MKLSKALIVLGVIAFLNPSLYAAPVAPGAVSAPFPDASRIGIVAAVHGSVQITQQGRAEKIADSGQPVFLGDTVSTDGKGSLQILLLDQTVFTIGPNSSIVIDKFIYDPSTHDGVVKARVVKGVFRFVTGKIGQKKPQQMEVDLPAGTIGIRGTIVAGEVDGKKSKIILLGPGENNNTGHREGKFILSNESSGQVRQETVSKTGFGSVIEGEGSAPSKPFQIPAAELTRITSVLGPLPPPEQGQDSQSDQGGPQPGQGEGSPTEQSGQGKAVAGDSANQARAVGRMVQRFTNESNQNAQRAINAFLEIKDGPTSRDQLQAAAQKMGGIAHFKSLNVPMTGAYTTGSQTASFYMDIDFGGRKVGGGNSRVDGTIFNGATFSFSAAVTNTQPFGFGQENAQFVFPVSSVSGSCGILCDSAVVNVGIDNKGGNVAQEAHMQVKIFDGGVEKAQASTVGTKIDGAS